MNLILALETAAPYYNLVLVTIVIILFIYLFKTQPKSKFMIPWKVLFAAVIVYIVEEILTVLRGLGIINISVHINGFFELTIITLFIYTLLKQKQIARC